MNEFLLSSTGDDSPPDRYVSSASAPVCPLRLSLPPFHLKVAVSASTRCLLELVSHSKSSDIFGFSVRAQFCERVATWASLCPTHGTQYGHLIDEAGADTISSLLMCYHAHGYNDHKYNTYKNTIVQRYHNSVYAGTYAVLCLNMN